MAGSAFKQFIVIFGGENIFIDRDLYKYRRSPTRSVLSLDGESLTEDRFLEYCEMTSDQPRTIVLDNAQALGTGKSASKLKGIQEFIENRDPNDWSLIVVVAYRGDRLPELWAKAATKGARYEREKIAWWDSDKRVDFVIREAESHKVRIERKVAEKLALFTGVDLYQIANEVRKLALLVGPLGTIKEEHIKQVTTMTPFATQFQVAEAVLERDSSCFRKFSTLCTLHDETTACILTCSALMNKVDAAVQTLSLQGQGLAQDSIAELLGMKPYKYKLWANTVKKHNLQALVKHMGQLCKLNSYVKLGNSKRTRIELFMLSVIQSGSSTLCTSQS